MATPQSGPATKKPATKTTVKGTSQASRVPLSYSWPQASLLYEQKATEGTWTSLKPAPGKPAPGKEGYSVSLMVDGDIEISQANSEAACYCRLRREVGFSFVGGTHAGKADVTISVIVLRPPEINFGGQQPELAEQFPLAKALVGVNALQLKIPPLEKFVSTGPKNRINFKSVKEIVEHIRVILTGRDTLDVKHPWHLLLNKDKDSLRLESIAQEKQLGLFKGCSIKTHAGKYHRCLIVEIFPGKVDQETAETKDFDFGSQKLGQSYVIEAPTLFPKDEETMKNHPILGQPGTLSWEIDIVKDTQGYDAPVVGIIRNIFANADLDSFIGEEEDVSLRPVFNDILGSRGVGAVSKLGDEIDEFSRQARGFLAGTSKNPSQLPVMSIFGGDDCDQAENTLPDADKTIPGELKNELNDTQAQALETALSKKASLLWGPPGTGKSYVVASLVRLLLLRNPAEKIVATAMVNVAVDSLLASCVKVWRKFDKDGPIPFIRVYSESQILSQWASEDMEKLSSPYHIDSVRNKLAISLGRTAYLDGRKELETYGTIVNSELYKGYAKDCRDLNEQLLERESFRVVFCTITACRSPALFKMHPADNEVEKYYKATTIIVDEAGIPTRPQMMIPAMTFLSAKRIFLAGDPMQLNALLLDKDARSWWSVSFFSDLVSRKFPFVFLNIQYRMHDALYAHLVKCIYKKPIGSHFLTSTPRPYLENLGKIMPLQVNAGNNQYSLNGFMHFLDVPFGETEVTSGGSSWRDTEVAVVEALVLRLINAGVPANSVAVMTGYREQLKKLQDKARWNNWSHIKQVLTVDSSQGDEYPIVIMSLVNTRGQPGFMGQRSRANVGTSRQKEAIFFVGQQAFWFTRPESGGSRYMHQILRNMHLEAGKHQPAPFLVSNDGVLASSPAVGNTAAQAPQPAAPAGTELPQLQPSEAEQLADWEGRAAMARNEKEEEATTRLEALKQEVARRREALEEEMARRREALEQEVAREEEALRAQISAERESLEIELAREKAELEESERVRSFHS